MARNRWHILQDDDALILARRLPARFDFCDSAEFPACGGLRLAQQIRQDLWRVLQNLSGFSPVIRVARNADVMVVQAGGQVDGLFPRNHVEQITQSLLTSTSHRKRWVHYAGEHPDA